MTVKTTHTAGAPTSIERRVAAMQAISSSRGNLQRKAFEAHVLANLAEDPDTPVEFRAVIKRYADLAMADALKMAKFLGKSRGPPAKVRRLMHDPTEFLQFVGSAERSYQKGMEDLEGLVRDVALKSWARAGLSTTLFNSEARRRQITSKLIGNESTPQELKEALLQVALVTERLDRGRLTQLRMQRGLSRYAVREVATYEWKSMENEIGILNSALRDYKLPGRLRKRFGKEITSLKKEMDRLEQSAELRIALPKLLREISDPRTSKDRREELIISLTQSQLRQTPEQQIIVFGSRQPGHAARPRRAPTLDNPPQGMYG